MSEPNSTLNDTNAEIVRRRLIDYEIDQGADIHEALTALRNLLAEKDRRIAELEAEVTRLNYKLME